MIKQFIEYVRKMEIETNTYIVNNEREALIIDMPNYSEEIKKYIKDNNLEIKYIILTHTHSDHILGLPEFIQDHPNTQICISEKEYPGILDKNSNLLELVKNSDEIQKILNKIEYKLLKNEEEIVLDGKEKHIFKIYETPGHTIGSIVIHYINENTLFSGDTIFKNSYGRFDLPTGNSRSLIKTLGFIRETFNENTIIYSGHGEKTKLKEELKNRYYYF